jgi:hypothetical protein
MTLFVRRLKGDGGAVMWDHSTALTSEKPGAAGVSGVHNSAAARQGGSKAGIALDFGESVSGVYRWWGFAVLWFNT